MIKILSNQLAIKPIVTINDFLNHFKNYNIINFEKGIVLDFLYNYNSNSYKLNPLIQLARPEDAKIITQIFKEVYEGTYPYKKMENIQEMCKMIKSSNYHWFIFKININEIIGCFGVRLEFEEKRGLFFGYAIKKKYHKIVDLMNTFIGCAIFVFKTYKNRILIWYSELRTNTTGAQFTTSHCGLKPISFFPNKDIFIKHIESDVMHIIYNKKALFKYRNRETPKIIRQVLNCYLYTNERYHLGNPMIENPENNIDLTKVNKIKKKLSLKKKSKKFNSKIITLFLKKSDSYFKFLYNPFIQNVENTTFRVNNLEELFVFVQEIKSLIKRLDIRYFECFISSYKPEHQKLFLEMGFKPMGYVPSWKYNQEKKLYEDRIVFIYFKGNLDTKIKLIPEASELFEALKLKTSEDLIFSKIY